MSNMANNSKNIQKTSRCSNRTHKKKEKLFHRFLGEYTLFLTSLFFLKGHENAKKLGSRCGTKFLKNSQGKSGGQRVNTGLEAMEFFHIVLLTISYHGDL